MAFKKIIKGTPGASSGSPLKKKSSKQKVKKENTLSHDMAQAYTKTKTSMDNAFAENVKAGLKDYDKSKKYFAKKAYKAATQTERGRTTRNAQRMAAATASITAQQNAQVEIEKARAEASKRDAKNVELYNSLINGSQSQDENVVNPDDGSTSKKSSWDSWIS